MTLRCRTPWKGNHINASQIRHRLAYISPLPPEKSGIADYSADLLPELAKFYDIDVIVTQDAVDSPPHAPRISIRSAEWFDRHAAAYRRILYHVGSSVSHRHMPEMLSRHPGIVVLHDFFLGELFDCRPPWQDCFPRILFEAHGYPALITELRRGRAEAMRAYPCNSGVLDRASGTIVHSRFSMRLGDQWRGSGSSAGWRYIPIPKPLPYQKARLEARRRLGIGENDFIVASFGFVVPFKLNDRLIDAWSSSPMAQDPRCRLIFIGECGMPKYAESLREANPHGERFTITGFVDRETYRAYLEAADIAVQLRLNSRGETSAAILDCLAYGIPTIINAHGSAAELPGNALVKLKEEFSQTDLRDALDLLWRDADLRKKLSAEAALHIRTFHDPARAARLYRDAIEHFASTPSRTERLEDFAAAGNVYGPPRKDIRPQSPYTQILIDITDWTHREESPLVPLRETLETLLDAPLEGCRIETVRRAETHYVYARTFTAALLKARGTILEDRPIHIQPGDLFLRPRADSLNLPHRARPQFLSELEARGARILDMPEQFLGPRLCASEVRTAFMNWIEPFLIAANSSGPASISKKTALKDFNCAGAHP